MGGGTAVFSLIKDEFLAPHCYRKKGTNPLVLTRNKENLANVWWGGMFPQFPSDIHLIHSDLQHQLPHVRLRVNYCSPCLSFLIYEMAMLTSCDFPSEEPLAVAFKGI